MFVNTINNRNVLIQDQFDGALVVDRDYSHPVKVYFRRDGSNELKLGVDYWVSDGTGEGDDALIATADAASISLEQGNVKVTQKGSDVLCYLHGENF